MDMGPALLALDPETLLFSDESYFDTNDVHRNAYQRPGEDQEQRKMRSATRPSVLYGESLGWATLHW